MKVKAHILFLFLLSIIFLPLHLFCQDAVAILKEAQQLEAVKNDAAALIKYKEVLKLQSSNLMVACKCSELSSVIGNRKTTKAEKMSYFITARNYAATALKINSKYGDANFVMAMAMGRIALISSGRERITAVNEIKKYADLAVLYDPMNYKAYHVLGKWHYEVSNLNAFERAAVKILYGGLPNASIAEAIKFYEKSRSLVPDYGLNYLELAKSYSRNKQPAKAIHLLQKLQDLPNKSEDDVKIKKDGNELLKVLLD